MTAELPPTQRWQALVPELRSLTLGGQTSETEAPMTDAEKAAARAADTAERLLLLLHYSIDWDNSWISDEKHRKTYWDELLISRVRRASYRSATLGEWWSTVTFLLDATAPRYPDRRLELAELLQEPPVLVLNAFQNNLPALLLRVRIIAEAVAAERKAKSG